MIKNWRSLIIFALGTTANAAPQFSFEPEKTPLIIEVSPVVILNAAAPTQKQNGGSLGWTGNVATGFGLLTAISISDSPFDFEFGAVYLKQISERDSAGTALIQETHNLHIPFQFRYNFDERVGIGIGGYAGVAKGSITTIQGASTSYASYNSSGVHDRDFGLLFTARASLRLLDQLYFIVDGRYQHGLSNLANTPPGAAGDTFNTRSMQAYLGLSYRFFIF